MKLHTLKTTLALSAVALGLTMASPSQADNFVTLNATISSASALSVTKVTDMDFGVWLFAGLAPSDTITFVKDTHGVVAAPDSTSPLTTTAQEISPAADPAEVEVTIPGGGSSGDVVVNLERGVITPFGDTNVTLQDITYRTATETAENALPASTPEDVTILAGGGPESVFFGGTIVVGESIADGLNTASFDVTFTY